MSTASQVKNAVQGYWSQYYGASISVNLTMYDVNGSVTTNTSLSVKNYYLITVNLALATPSFTFAGAYNTTAGP